MNTVGTIDIAQKIRRPGETQESAVNRVKSWVREGIFDGLLLETEPGTGREARHRRGRSRVQC